MAQPVLPAQASQPASQNIGNPAALRDNVVIVQPRNRNNKAFVCVCITIMVVLIRFLIVIIATS